MSRQSFEFCCRFLLQQAVVCRNLKILCSFLLKLRKHCYDIFISFSMITLSQKSFLFHDNILFIPQTCTSQHRYTCRNMVLVQLLQVGVATQLFLSRQHFYSSSYCNTVLYYFHLGCDPKSQSRQSSVTT